MAKKTKKPDVARAEGMPTMLLVEQVRFQRKKDGPEEDGIRVAERAILDMRGDLVLMPWDWRMANRTVVEVHS